MRSLKLLGVSALVSNKDALYRHSNGAEIAKRPVAIEEPIFGRRKVLISILAQSVAVVAAGPVSANALDMDAFINSEVSQ